MPLKDTAARWFLDRRGIERATLDAFGIESEGEGVLIPYPDGAVKHRATLEKVDGKHRMWYDPRAPYGQPPFLSPNWTDEGETKIVWEGETDTMAAWQNAPPEVQPHIAGMGGANLFGDKGLPTAKIEQYFGKADRVFFVLDNEDPYEGNAAYETVERAKKQIRAKLGRKAKFVTLPGSAQDGCEFFQTFDWAAFMELMKQAAKGTRHYRRLDLTQPVPPTDWLVEDLLVSGEITVLSADSGVGKSWLTMGLALAVAGGADTFLGLKLNKHGRVLYVDEENPADLVVQRFDALRRGMKLPIDVMSYIEYLWYEGVDLAGEPEKLQEEALDIEPALILLDSLSRVSLGVDENSNTDMSKLFRNGLVPLARDTGAAVIAAHHTPADNAGKPRGATAIKAAGDEVLSMLVPQDKAGNKRDYISLYPSKPRRQLTTTQFRIVGDMEAGDPVTLENVKDNTPF